MTLLFVLLQVLGWMVGILAALLLLIVALPFDARAVGHLDDESIDGLLAVRWGWGLLAVRATPAEGFWLCVLGLRIWRIPVEEETPQDEEAEVKAVETKAAGKEEKPEKKEDATPATAFLRWVKDERGWLLRTGRRAISALHLRLRLQGVVGLDDPADTFVLCELLALVDRLPGVAIDLERDYLDDTFELDLSLSFRLWLLELLGVSLTILLTRETWRALRAMP